MYIILSSVSKRRSGRRESPVIKHGIERRVDQRKQYIIIIKIIIIIIMRLDKDAKR